MTGYAGGAAIHVGAESAARPCSGEALRREVISMSNRLGENLKLTIFGQSHAPGIGCVIEGLPAGVTFDWERVNGFMQRRAPGRDALSTARREADRPEILAGLNERGETCGAPLAALIRNGDQRPQDYDRLRDLPRPGHADYTAAVKFGGYNDIRGGGPFSGRLTAPLCFAGALCLQLLEPRGVTVGAHALSIAGEQDRSVDSLEVTPGLLREAAARAPAVFDEAAGERMRAAVERARLAGDSVGGVVEAFALGFPAGYGDPMFDGVENRLAQAVFGIPAVRGVAFGEGFAAADMRGSEHNDAFFCDEGGAVRTRTNRHAGILGGISSGMPIVMRVAFKPTPSIGVEQETVSLARGEGERLIVGGRHDPCIVPRAVPVVEAAMAFVLCDLLMGREPGT